MVDGMREGKGRETKRNSLACEKRGAYAPMRRCERLAIMDLRRGSGKPKKNWGEVIRQDMVHL